MRSPKELRAAIERALPRLTTREWASIAELAAQPAGLDAEDVATLRRSLRDARQNRARRTGRQRFHRGDPVRMRGGAGGVMTVEEYRGNLVPKEVLVVWATAAGLQRTQTIPADLLELAPEARRGRRAVTGGAPAASDRARRSRRGSRR